VHTLLMCIDEATNTRSVSDFIFENSVFRDKLLLPLPTVCSEPKAAKLLYSVGQKLIEITAVET
jgi:hypothetical protein